MGQLPGCTRSAIDSVVSWGQDYSMVANSKKHQRYDHQFQGRGRQTWPAYTRGVLGVHLIYLGMKMISTF